MSEKLISILEILLKTKKISSEKYLDLARTYKAAKDKALQEQLSLDLFGIGGDENV